MTTLAIIEPRLLAQQFFENTNFFLQIFDHAKRRAIHPAGEANHRKGKLIHCHRMATPPSIRQRPLPLPNPLKKVASVVKFEYLYTAASGGNHGRETEQNGRCKPLQMDGIGPLGQHYLQESAALRKIRVTPPDGSFKYLGQKNYDEAGSTPSSGCPQPHSTTS
jgi:hypothetical protein